MLVKAVCMDFTRGDWSEYEERCSGKPMLRVRYESVMWKCVWMLCVDVVCAH